jgi:hypothetical protein
LGCEHIRLADSIRYVHVGLETVRTRSRPTAGEGTCVQVNAEPAQAQYAFMRPYGYAAACGVSEHDVLRAV